MLRSYAAAGLLVPAAVDASSGYRYYSAGQLHQARIVALLRRAGIAVGDISRFFDHPDSVQLDHWERQLVRESKVRRQALAQARAALALGDAPLPDESEAMTKGTEVAHDFVAGTATHCGGSDANQDAVLVSEGLYAVADGIGGLQDGDVASRLALDTLDAAFAANRSMSGLLDACREANQAVWRQAHKQDAVIGTTLAALAVTADVATIGVHAGDSRLYRLSNGRLEQLTHDHTVIADLIRADELNEDEARTHPHRNVLTRALGVGPEVDLDHAGVSCEPGDRLVLCTDGLFKVLSPSQIKAILASETEPQQSADDLVSNAVERGAEDDVTAVVVDVH